MSNTSQITLALKDLILKDHRAFVAMLSGEWGIGKTYFWNEVFVPTYLKDKDIVYISLFGANSLEDIETKILTKLSSFTQFQNDNKTILSYLKKATSFVSNVSGYPINIAAGAILSLFNPKDFKNLIICFDDFERLSEKVSLKDVMGLISQFKEQKECKVIMILNEKELDNLDAIDGKKQADVFAHYKEKIVDYNFHYIPTQDELFEAIKEDVEKIKFCSPDVIYSFFKKINLKNIRIMKQALYQLGHFDFIDNGLDKKVINEFVEITLNLFVFNAISNFSYKKLQDFKSYKAELEAEVLFPNGTKISRNQTFDKYLTSYHGIPYYLTNDNMEKLVYKFITTHIKNEKSINTLLRYNNTHSDKENIRQKVFNSLTQAYSDFNTPIKECAEHIFTLLEENKDLIPYIFKLSELETYFVLINEHTNLINKEFRDNYIKSYITLKPSQNGYQGDYNYGNYKTFIEKNYTHLLGYLEEERYKELLSEVSMDKLLTLLEKVHHSIGPEDKYILNNISADTYKKYIKKSSDFYHTLSEFLVKNHGGFFNPAIESIKQAFRELKNENKDNAWRITQLAKRKNIVLEENV